MKALVTGATGFVGAALTRRLLAEGACVHVLLRDDKQAPELEAAGARVHMGTVGDPNQVAEAASGCEVLFHCAGENSHRSAPLALEWTNVAGTENVINAARHVCVRRVVHLSCADTTLINRDRFHWKEDRVSMTRPLDPCARSKLLAEELAIAASCQSTEVTAIRGAWLWGPGDRTTLPALCIEAAQGGVRLFGNGRNLVATLYIDNLVDALLAASQVPEAACNVYYISDGEFLDAGEFLGMLCRSLGLPPPKPGFFPLAYALAWMRERFGLDGPWPTDVVRRGRNSLFDTHRALQDLGYEPRVSVEKGMERVAAWAEQMGGPQAIANTFRHPASEAAVAALVAAASGSTAEQQEPSTS